jgi:hypothetical protein
MSLSVLGVGKKPGRFNHGSTGIETKGISGKFFWHKPCFITQNKPDLCSTGT